MNTEPPPARYLPPHLAEALRRAAVTVPDPQARGEIVSLAEDAYAQGYADSYARGFTDGAWAERDATLSPSALLTHQHTELQVRMSAP